MSTPAPASSTSTSDLRFHVAGRIARPIDEVFEAVVAPDQLSQYFTTGGAKGRLETGATVTWDFADFPGAFPVDVVEVTAPTRIVLEWGAVAEGPPRRTTVTMEFAALPGDRTLVTIAEESWPDTDSGRAAAFANCEGWTGMLCALKAWIDHGVRLRDGFYV